MEKSSSKREIATEGMYNMEPNDKRKNICMRKSEVSVERISVCYVNEQLKENSIYTVCHAPIPVTS